MKIAISSSGTTLDTAVDSRFGRCPYFLIVDSETLTFEAQPNAGAGSGGGAGIQAAQFVVQTGAKAVITGNVGPNAYQVLNAAGITIHQMAGMSARQAVEALRGGQEAPMSGASQAAHAGVNEPQAQPTRDEAIAGLKQEITELRGAVAALLEKIDQVAKQR